MDPKPPSIHKDASAVIPMTKAEKIAAQEQKTRELRDSLNQDLGKRPNSCRDNDDSGFDFFSRKKPPLSPIKIAAYVTTALLIGPLLGYWLTIEVTSYIAMTRAQVKFDEFEARHGYSIAYNEFIANPFKGALTIEGITLSDKNTKATLVTFERVYGEISELLEDKNWIDGSFYQIDNMVIHEAAAAVSDHDVPPEFKDAIFNRKISLSSSRSINAKTMAVSLQTSLKYEDFFEIDFVAETIDVRGLGELASKYRENRSFFPGVTEAEYVKEVFKLMGDQGSLASFELRYNDEGMYQYARKVAAQADPGMDLSQFDPELEIARINELKSGYAKTPVFAQLGINDVLGVAADIGIGIISGVSKEKTTVISFKPPSSVRFNKAMIDEKGVLVTLNTLASYVSVSNK